MSPAAARIAYITAGAAGMFCGSCLRDNTLVMALRRLNVDVSLIPTYTPIRTDETDASLQDHVFFGGINVYLQQKLPLFRHLPGWLDHWLDRPGIIRRLTRGGVSTSPQNLGALTVSMLQGMSGFQAKEVRRLVGWLRDEQRPDLINLTNLLIAGCVPALKEQLGVPVLVTLQGDDAFLEYLPQNYRDRALEQIRRLADQVDGFIVFSRYYADFMADYFRLPREKLHQVPLGINVQDFADSAGDAALALPAPNAPRTIGYLARLTPEKGLHILVDAFLHLRQDPGMADVNLLLAGWLGPDHETFVRQQFERLDQAGLHDAYRYLGAVDRQQKRQFLQQIDVLSVPTTYREPKGLYVLEALAAGVPVVQPAHGAFPELLAATGGGRLCRPADPLHLAEQLRVLLRDRAACRDLGRQGQARVLADHTAERMARETLSVYRRFLPSEQRTQ